MNVTFWGVRGSIPTPGPETMRWGGNSSCIEIRSAAGDALVLDCGTGARGLGEKLSAEGVTSARLVFSHLHLDHVYGLPYFQPVYTPGFDLTICVPAFDNVEAQERISRLLNGTFHPTRLRDVPASIEFRAVKGGTTMALEPFELRSLRLNHPGGCMGYRVQLGDVGVGYFTDTAPFARPGEGVMSGKAPTAAEERVMSFLRNCDFVIYDTMYDVDEYLKKMTWGHSYPEYAVALCRAAGVQRIAMFHHRPDASDAFLDARFARFADVQGIDVLQAREGQTWELGA